MRITKQTRDSIRLLQICATQNDRRLLTHEIANRMHISSGMLSKLLPPLIKHGLVDVKSGKNGGIKIAKKPSEISLLDVVDVTETDFQLAECFRSEIVSCPLVRSCAYNGALKEALDAFRVVLSERSIEQISNRENVNA